MAEYINNQEFEKLVKDYITTKDKATEDRLIFFFDKLINNIITSFKFKVEEDDAKQECFLLVLKTLKNFKPENGKAFNYFTTVIINNLRLIYTKNKLYHLKIENYIKLHGNDLKNLID